MVVDIQPELAGDKARLGTYAGLLGSSFYVGQLISSFIWGRLSDRYGRRPILLAGAFFTFAAVQAFGFSTNYYYALVTRLLAGALNGNLGVIKTYLGEITDSTNQTKAFSLFSGCQGIAAILGAAAGGYLARPAIQYPSLFAQDGFFGIFPYFLVNTVAAVVLLVGFILAVIFLKESRKFDQDVLDQKLESHALSLLAHVDHHDDHHEHEHDSVTSSATSSANSSPAPSTPGTPGGASSAGPKWTLFKDSVAVSTSLYYSFLGLLFICYDEVYSTWTVAPVGVGGLDFETSHLGAMGALGGVAILIVQRFIYPWFTGRFGLLRTLRWGIWLAVPLFIVWPLMNIIRIQLPPVPPLWWWLPIGALVMFRVLVAQLAFTPIIQMVNNSVSPQHMGAVNGFGQSAVAFLRAVGPAAAGTALQHALELHDRTFLAHYIPWYFMLLPINLILVACAHSERLLPQRLNMPMHEWLLKQKAIESPASSTQPSPAELPKGSV